jgi:hypothetical protein
MGVRLTGEVADLVVEVNPPAVTERAWLVTNVDTGCAA